MVRFNRFCLVTQNGVENKQPGLSLSKPNLFYSSFHLSVSRGEICEMILCTFKYEKPLIRCALIDLSQVTARAYKQLIFIPFLSISDSWISMKPFTTATWCYIYICNTLCRKLNLFQRINHCLFFFSIDRVLRIIHCSSENWFKK